MAGKLWCSILAALLLMPAPSQGAAGEASRAPATSSLEQTLETAPVEIDGQVLFQVRGLSSFPADKRAKGIQQRIVDVASNRLDVRFVTSTGAVADHFAIFDGDLVFADGFEAADASAWDPPAP